MADAISNLEEQIRVRKEEKVKTLNLIKELKGQKDKEYLAVLNMRKHNRINTNIEDMEGRLRNLKNLKNLKGKLDELSRQQQAQQQRRPFQLAPLQSKSKKANSSNSIMPERQIAASPPNVAPLPNVAASPPNSKDKNDKLRIRKEAAVISYIDMRSQYLLKFIKNVSTILGAYITTNTALLNGTVLNNINGLIRQLEQLEQPDNIEAKIRYQNVIIENFLNYIDNILKDKQPFKDWLSSNDYSKIRTSFINTKLIGKGWSQKDIDDLEKTGKFNGVNIEEYTTGDLPLSVNLVDGYNKVKNEYIVNNTFNIPRIGGGPSMSCFSNKNKNKVAPAPQSSQNSSRSPRTRTSVSGVSDDIECDDVLDFEEASHASQVPQVPRASQASQVPRASQVPHIVLYRYIMYDIHLFFQIMDNVLIYIDNLALFLSHIGKQLQVFKKKIEGEVNNIINIIITDRRTYFNDLEKFEENYYDIMSSNINEITSSSYMSIYMDDYNKKQTSTSGGRKQRRTVGRPRKTPSKKAAKKPIAKPAKAVKKQVANSIKSAKKPVAKPVKSAKPATKKPSATKPLAKPVNPAKPTKK